MTVGAVVLATEQGLGILAKSFYDNEIIQKVYIHKHSSRENHYEWYGADSVSKEELLKCDIILFFENAFDWKLIPQARERRVKTVLMPMYECTPYPLPYSPDLILTPSLLDLQYYREGRGVVVPTDVKWKLRERARVFVHNAGNGGLGGRNGTKELLEAMQYVKSPIQLIVRSQSLNLSSDDPRVTIEGSIPYEDLYKKGDVFIFPEKFNGLSLPMQEAFASGMPVMGSDRFPINTWLPKEILIPVSGYKKERLAVEFDLAILSPQQIAATIDEWYDKDITHLSLLGKEFNKQSSWKVQKEVYLSILKSIL